MRYSIRVFLVLILATTAQVLWAEKLNPAINAEGSLSKEFHAGRRNALRQLMPANSVAIVFAYPERNFSNDVDYPYHPNPDLYYFSGYREPDALLLIFKENQQDTAGNYNEILFVRKRDAAREQWTGKRLGIEGAKEKLGFTRVYNGEEFATACPDLKPFQTLLYGSLPSGLAENMADGSLYNITSIFKQKAQLPNQSQLLIDDLSVIANAATPENIDNIIKRLIEPKLGLPDYKSNLIIQKLLAKPNAAALESIKAAINQSYAGIMLYHQLVASLREIKTPEELVLMRKSCELSAIAHKETMQAITPAMSEREVQGVLEFVHRKYDAEGEGYPPIVGAGGNGCILHYIENDLPKVDNQLVLMDVGAEYRGYSADVTRTIPASGQFSSEQKAIYELVYEAQEEVFKLCKEGTAFPQLNRTAREVLAKGLLKLGIINNASELSRYYPHGCSHHLGLDVHDKSNYQTLQENMIITVEPGIYIPAGSPCDKKWWNIAVRIEDDVIIGKTAGENISMAAPRRWQDVEKAMAEKSVLKSYTLPALKN